MFPLKKGNTRAKSLNISGRFGAAINQSFFSIFEKIICPDDQKSRIHANFAYINMDNDGCSKEKFSKMAIPAGMKRLILSANIADRLILKNP